MKLLPLAQLIATHVGDGQSLALEGFTHLIPFAAGHEIIRQGRRNLHLIRMTPDILYDQMIGMGCAAQLTFSWAGNPGVGSLHRVRDAVEHGWPAPLALREFAHAQMAVAYQAGASALPCGVMRQFGATGLQRLADPLVRSLRCPFSGAMLEAVPAINPDVTILHAQQIDAAGNVLIRGIVGAAREAALAARRVLVTVEEQVERFDAGLNAVVLPAWVVTAASVVPGGAHPSYAHGYYARDNAFCQAWDDIARERDSFLHWMRQHILETPDHGTLLRRLGVAA